VEYIARLIFVLRALLGMVLVRSRSLASFTSLQIGKRWLIDKLRLIEELQQRLLLAKQMESQPNRHHPTCHFTTPS